MTYAHNFTLPQDMVEYIIEQGSDSLPEILRIMINEALKVERQKYLGAGSYERSPERRDSANGYKPKTMKTRVGEVTFNIHRCEKVVSIFKLWRRGCAANRP